MTAATNFKSEYFLYQIKKKYSHRDKDKQISLLKIAKVISKRRDIFFSNKTGNDTFLPASMLLSPDATASSELVMSP